MTHLRPLHLSWHALLAWLDQPLPVLGDYAYGAKLAALAVGALLAYWLLDRVTRLALVVRRALWNQLRQFWVTAFPPEIPGADADDQSQHLEESVSLVLDDLARAAAAVSAKATEQAGARAQQVSRSILEECRLSADRLKKAFRDKESSAQIELLESEARMIGHLLLSAASEHRHTAAAAPLGLSAVRHLRAELLKLAQSVPLEYRVRQTKEQLGAEPGDTLFVRAFKLQRRLTLFLTSLTGKARAQGRVRRIPLRSIVVRILLEDMIDDLRPPAETLDRDYAESSTQMRESAKIARFNLHSAGALLDGDEGTAAEPPGEALQLALDGIDRTGARIEKLPEEIETLTTAFAAAVSTAVERAGKQLRRDCDVADTFGERVAVATASLLSTWRLFEERGQRKLHSTRSWTEALRARGREAFAGLQTALGIKKPQIELSQATLEEATIEFALKNTPLLYRRLFRFEPLTDEDFLTGCEKFMPAMRAIRQRFNSGLSAAVAVIGPVGLGKTSFTRCALQRHFPDQKPAWIQLQKHLSSESDFVELISTSIGWSTPVRENALPNLVSAIRALPDRPVFVIEGGSMLHLRRVGGFDAVRSLFSLLSNTEGKACWIITFSQAGWDYLDRTFDIFKRFDSCIMLRGLDRTELESALMARHEVSGYDLEFTEGPSLSADIRWKLRQAKDREKRQAILCEEFFDTLHAAAGRNLHAALYYWLRSTQSEGRRKVHVAPLSPFRKEILGDLTLSELFGMLYTLEHDHLTAPLLSQLLRSPLTESRTLLDYLTHRRILSCRREEGAEPRYAPNPILLGPVLEALRDKNFIHA
ncbi:MAG: hypothetical protein ABIJ96_14425 [Elusimicrobiota bacterium]